MSRRFTMSSKDQGQGPVEVPPHLSDLHCMPFSYQATRMRRELEKTS